MHKLLFLSGCVALLVAAPACGDGGVGGTGAAGGSGGGPAGDKGSVIVGVISNLRVGVDIDKLHVVLRASGSVVKDEVLAASGGDLPLVLPAELPFRDLPGGTPVDV